MHWVRKYFKYGHHSLHQVASEMTPTTFTFDIRQWKLHVFRNYDLVWCESWHMKRRTNEESMQYIFNWHVKNP